MAFFDILDNEGHRVDMQLAVNGEEAMSKYYRDCHGIKALRPQSNGKTAVLAPLPINGIYPPATNRQRRPHEPT